MIIVLKSGISDADVQDVCQRITEMGYGPHVIRGEFKTIVAAVGEERGRPDLRLLEALETVESVMPVQQPFKLASREVRRESTEVRINGVTVGAGMGMSLMCDMRIASDAARFSTGYVRVGLVPGDGDTYFLPRLIGTAKALELLWTADFIEAPKALELGIVNRVVPHDKLHEETYAFARRVADGPQIPVRMIKRLVYQSMRLDLRTHLDLVSSHMAVVRETEDHKEGVQAFKDKRAPKFTGR